MLTNEASFEERRFRMADVAVAGDKATKTPFYATADSNGVVWRLKPGQEIAPHMHTTSDDIWICLQGKGEFYPEKGVKKPIQAGDVIVKGSVPTTETVTVNGVSRTVAINWTPAKLKKAYADCVTVLGVTDNRRAPNAPHWKVTAT